MALLLNIDQYLANFKASAGHSCPQPFPLPLPSHTCTSSMPAAMNSSPSRCTMADLASLSSAPGSSKVTSMSFAPPMHRSLAAEPNR